MVCQMPRSSIALFEDIDWRTVGNCIKAAHDRIEPDVTIRMHDLRRICVDETSYRKGFTYITVVYDMDRNRVVWVHPGNGLEIFRLFCEALSIEERNKIEIVAGDGAQWIDTCTKLYFPNATRCIDFFHVAEWANEALDKVRVSTANKAATEYEQRKREFQAAEAEAEKAAAEAEEQRRSAELELESLPKRGRPSSRKLELLAFLAGLQETALVPAVTEEQLRSAEAELAALPKRGRPSKRKLELLAFLADPQNTLLGTPKSQKMICVSLSSAVSSWIRATFSTQRLSFVSGLSSKDGSIRRGSRPSFRPSDVILSILSIVGSTFPLLIASALSASS
jgi:hypothetical protein